MSRLRGFAWLEKYKSLNRSLPQRKTKGSAGYDLAALEAVRIEAESSLIIETGLKAYMQADEVLLLFIRSSIAIKKNLRLVNGVGVIDSDYYNNPQNEGQILIALENLNPYPIEIQANELLAQGIFTKFLLTQEDRSEGLRIGGIGSTDSQKEK